MTRIDQFESVFRAAARTVFTPEPVEVGSVLVISDRTASEADDFAAQARTFLKVLDQTENIRWHVVHGDEFRTVPDLLELVEGEHPGLICTYRHLHAASWRWPYTLGEYVDVLTQATTTPVVVMPHPERAELPDVAHRRTQSVMAMTNRLTGDNRLVNYAARYTQDGGTLYLSHVEDDAVFELYMEAISKIASIDTNVARSEIEARLMKDPQDYIESCQVGLSSSAPSLEVESLVTSGHHMQEYRRLIEEHDVDLLVMNTKDEDQLAMHGLAYPLAIELRTIPLLML